MKKQILFFGALFSFGAMFSQNIFPTGTGTNVGIGTTSPSTRLQVTSSTAGTSGLRLTNMTSTTSTVTGNNKALSVDASGNIILTPVVNTSPTLSNIYNSNGTVSSNRLISLNNFNLNFNSTTTGGNLFINGTTGNVGIGNTAPTVKLDVSGFVKAKSILATNSGTSATSFGSNLDYLKNSNVIGAGYEMPFPSVLGINRRMLNFYDFHEWSNEVSPNDDYFLFNIVDRNNLERFSYYGNKAGGASNGQSGFVLNDKNQAEFFKIMDDGNNNIRLQMSKSNSRFIIGGYADYAPGMPHKFIVQNGSALIEGNILTDSNIGIGTTNFADGTDTYRLSVKGAVRAERVKVYTTWADFVFEDDYKLATLEEVENHIKKFGHLKDIPSAKEVEKNGIELGEMNKKLLQKVEELTLYIIEMNKEIQELKELKKN